MLGVRRLIPQPAPQALAVVVEDRGVERAARARDPHAVRMAVLLETGEILAEQYLPRRIERPAQLPAEDQVLERSVEPALDRLRRKRRDLRHEPGWNDVIRVQR